MAKCNIKYCNEKIGYLCICNEEHRFICKEHLEQHIKTPASHEIISMESTSNHSSIEYLRETLGKNIGVLNEIKAKLKNFFEELQFHMKKTNESIQLIDEKIEQVEVLLSSLGINSYSNKSNAYAYAQFKSYTQIAPENLKRLIILLNPIKNNPLVLPSIDLQIPEEFFKIIEKISRPSIRSVGKLQIQYEVFEDFEDGFDKRFYEKKNAFKYFSGKMNDEDVTVKMYEFNEFTKAQVENHENFSGRFPGFLNVKSKFKKNNKLQIVTESWTHTVWNEFYARVHTKAFFEESKVVELLKNLLIAFENFNSLLLFTPSIAHITSNGDWKIWFPMEVTDIRNGYSYCAPEIWKNEEYYPSSCNLYSIGLVILQIGILEDTSEFCKLPDEIQRGLIMKIRDNVLRMCLIGILLKKNFRKSYATILKCYEDANHL